MQAPFYRTTWFRLICLLTFLAISYFYFKFREKQIREFTEKTLLKAKNQEIQHTLDLLKSTQDKLIQSEKLASLGELTSGIAHEIQNPLNFVNNFSEIGIDLTTELKEEINKSQLDKAYIDEILTDLAQNQTKINYHGKRASNIVSRMLEHSKPNTGKYEITDIQQLIEESIKISYQGFRTKNKDFIVNIRTEFEENLPKIKTKPIEMSRVIINILNNAFYAIKSKKYKHQIGEVIVTCRTLNQDSTLEILIKDNGVGIPESILPKIFQPFFTTKPTGEGTGLGLSLAYDIITKGHGGTIEVESVEKESSTFILKF